MYKFKTLIDLSVFNKTAAISGCCAGGGFPAFRTSYATVAKKICCLFWVFVMFLPKVYAQKNISIEKTIEYINSKFGGEYVIAVNYGTLVATYFENGDNKYREDQVNIKELSADKVTFNPRTRMLLLNCKSPAAKCVTREFLAKRLYYNRVSFVMKLPEKSINGLVKAFQHLIRSINERNYESAEPFE